MDEEKTVRDIELPQSIIDSFARFLVPEIRKFYESEDGQRALAEREVAQDADYQKSQ